MTDSDIKCFENVGMVLYSRYYPLAQEWKNVVDESPSVSRWNIFFSKFELKIKPQGAVFSERILISNCTRSKTRDRNVEIIVGPGLLLLCS